MLSVGLSASQTTAAIGNITNNATTQPAEVHRLGSLSVAAVLFRRALVCIRLSYQIQRDQPYGKLLRG